MFLNIPVDIFVNLFIDDVKNYSERWFALSRMSLECIILQENYN